MISFLVREYIDSRKLTEKNGVSSIVFTEPVIISLAYRWDMTVRVRFLLRPEGFAHEFSVTLK